MNMKNKYFDIDYGIMKYNNGDLYIGNWKNDKKKVKVKLNIII